MVIHQLVIVEQGRGVFNSYSIYCIAKIPNLINIKPLNNTDTGTATYAGLVVVQHGGNYSSRDSNGYTYNSALTKNIDIIVNFDDKTLSYSGNLVFRDASRAYSQSASYKFSINGDFTDRGILTGIVNFNSYGFWDTKAPLIGLIGEDELIGIFSSKESFAGGFTATRQE